MTEEETEGETITGDVQPQSVQSVLEPDEAFVVVKEETIESKLGIKNALKINTHCSFVRKI